MTSRQIRDALGLDRTQWARALSVSTNTVDRWESDLHTPVGLLADVMNGIALALERIPPDQHHAMGMKIRLGIGALITYGLLEMLPR